LANVDGAKNRVVEVIGLHRILAAPERGMKENRTIRINAIPALWAA
jgi:hypothetical protein